MMKLVALLFLSIACFGSASLAFVPVTPFSASSSSSFGLSRRPNTKRCETCLQSRPDSSDAVAYALEMSKKHGPTSKEARSAWDIVEEIDASDNSAAYSGGETDQRVRVDPTFNARLQDLSSILAENEERMKRLKSLVNEIQAIKLKGPAAAANEDKDETVDTNAMKKAITEAKEISDKFGADSGEAKVAWAAVEEIAASDNSSAYLATLDEECLVNAIEACEALEELNRVLQMKEFQGSRYSG